MREKPAETKEVLRRRLIATRRGTSFEARLEWSRLICRQVCESETFERAELVVAYLPQGAEVDPGDVAAAALETGRELYYPAPAGAVAVRRSDTVAAAGATSRAGGDDVLTRNTPQVLVLVPGVAFDASGCRLGRGRGWYDRLLERFDRAGRWGLAFALQLVPHLPVDPWDIAMDVVVTERGRIEVERSPRLPEGTA